MSIRGLEAAELLGYNVPEKESKAERKKEKKRSKTPERFEKSKKHKHKNSRGTLICCFA